MANTDPQRVIIPNARFSYEHLLRPNANPNNPDAEPKYSVTLLIPKSDTATKAAIDAAIKAATDAGVSTKWNGVRPPQVKHPVHDGDGVRQSGEPFGDECRGHWVMTASSYNRPDLIDENFQPIVDASQIYSGIYGMASVRFYPYQASGNRGVAAGLGNVRKTADGAPLGASGPSAAEEFAGFATMAPQQPAQYAPQPQGVYQPPQQQANTALPWDVQQPVQPQQTTQQVINPITGLPEIKYL